MLSGARPREQGERRQFDLPQILRGKIDFEVIFVQRFESNTPTAESGADRDQMIFIFEVSPTAYLSPYHSGVIKITRSAFIFLFARFINLCGRFHSQRLMRAHRIKGLAPQFQRCGLFSKIPMATCLNLGGDISVHAFVASVVLGLARDGPALGLFLS